MHSHRTNRTSVETRSRFRLMTYPTFHKRIKHMQAGEDECKHTMTLIENTAQISLINLSPLQAKRLAGLRKLIITRKQASVLCCGSMSVQTECRSSRGFEWQHWEHELGFAACFTLIRSTSLKLILLSSWPVSAHMMSFPVFYKGSRIHICFVHQPLLNEEYRSQYV